jgi:hypothetical protein
MQAGFNVALASTVTLDAALSFEAYGVIELTMPACLQLPNLITFWEAFLDFMIDHDKSAVQAHSHNGSIYQETISVSHFNLLGDSWLSVSHKTEPHDEPCKKAVTKALLYFLYGQQNN